jgi:thiamine pyrophosphate-dependent acetolactate synthase large subunit-like protein
MFYLHLDDIILRIGHLQVYFERPAGGKEAIARAAELLSNAKFPVILISTLPSP